MNFKSIFGTTCACLAVVSFNANSDLVGRLATTPGGTDYQAYYDQDTDLTWLADANAPGLLTWFESKDWAANLNINDVTGWRLPDTMQPDPSCSSQSTQPGEPTQGFGTGCTGSEMGHLFFVEGISAVTNGPFSNVQFNQYWSRTGFKATTTSAWVLNFSNGDQGAVGTSVRIRAWAVHDGDVGIVPVPTAVWLFGSGLLGLVGVARRKA